MIHAQNVKLVSSLPTAAVGSTATSTITVDRLGYDHVSVSCIRASNAATTFASVLKVEESDNNSDYSDVTALVGGGVGGFTIPAVSDTSSASVVKIDIDARARKRYLKVSMTPGATATLAFVASLSRAEESPVTASDAGVIGWVKG
jgi:NADPH-dependent curcumin reductase CurA